MESRSPGEGAVVMAFGIFGLGALEHIPVLRDLSVAMAALAALLFAVVFVRQVRALRRRGLAAVSDDRARRLAMGTWVAASVVTAKLLVRALPWTQPLTAMLEAVAVVVLVWFLAFALPVLAASLADPVGTGATGALLLTTVALQSVVLSTPDLVPGSPRAAWLPFLAGLGCYALGGAAVLRRYAASSRWRLDRDWHNTNCILHGALSISGLAAATVLAAPALLTSALWIAAASLFVAVELIELLRLAIRIRNRGWRQAFVVHDISQWARNFTFGMFYAFTVAVPPAALGGPARHVHGVVAAQGQYVVLALLVAQITVFVADRATRRDGRKVSEVS